MGARGNDPMVSLMTRNGFFLEFYSSNLLKLSRVNPTFDHPHFRGGSLLSYYNTVGRRVISDSCFQLNKGRIM